MSDGKFRSAIGGFNRQDVAEYIEGMAKRSKAAKEELEALSRTNSTMEARLKELEQSAAKAAETEEELRGLLSLAEQERDAAVQLAVLKAREEAGDAIARQKEKQSSEASEVTNAIDKEIKTQTEKALTPVEMINKKITYRMRESICKQCTGTRA